ncbi:site-specific integrase [Candidatus Manganitrophus noduliformans]|uniref:Site-specific integrase n=1 Tax=Candidatus Manganitrophus noduliformans TaxID=2606439 RepID=A0A7X6IB03_9BACT|nr:site-specific integrase [Candidatus Manganitrophus noduliformans]NKE71261.1 site-specific integrase [Candidatus Manganitrophus noduliformans]
MARKNRENRGLFEKPVGSGRWWVRCWINGKDHREFVGTKTEARNRYEDLTGKIRKGEMIADCRKTKISDLITLGLNEAKANDRKSLKEFERFAALLGEYCGSWRAAALTTDDCNKYRTLRKEGKVTTKDPEKRKNQKIRAVTDSTINRELAWLRHVYRLGFRNKPRLVAQVPEIPFVDENNVREGFFDLGEFERLKEHLPAHLKPVVTLGYYTGMRLGEILNLRWSQVDFGAGVLRLESKDTKNRRPRNIPLGPEVRSVLEAWRFETMTKYPACDRVAHFDGRPIERITRSWKTACRRAGLPGKLFHDLRRTAVRNMTKAGVDRTVAKRISGHKTDSVFERYDIKNDRDLIEAAEKVEAYLKGQNQIPIGKKSALSATDLEEVLKLALETIEKSKKIGAPGVI